MSAKAGSEEWLVSITKKANLDKDRVSEVLVSNRIFPAPIIPTPKRLTIQRIAFSGVKTGLPDESEDIEFNFDWSNLTPGLWAMLTERNLKGKSSIIEIVKWMLRGRPSDNLQADVRSWISSCALRFGVDETTYEVQVHIEDELKGKLVRAISDEQRRVCASFTGETEFEAVMSDFFLRELSLDMITVGKEKSVVHGWPALSGVLFIGTNYSTLLGDVPPSSGLTIPLLQMYLGLPWVSTYTSAQAALNAHQREQDARTRSNESAKRARRLRMDSIQAELAGKHEELSGTPSDKDIRDSLERLSSLFVKGKANEREVLGRHERILQSIIEAEQAYASDRRELQSFLDAEAAGAVFKKLDPVFCPRCDHKISEEKKRHEATNHSCSICGEKVNSDEDTERIEEQMKSRVDASKAALDYLQQEQDRTQKELEGIRKHLEETERQLNSFTLKSDTFDARRALEMEIATLEARLSELGMEDDAEIITSNELEVLSVTVDESKQRAKELQSELLSAVSEEMLRYGQRFGMTNLTAVELKGDGKLPVVKGGKNTSYSHLTKGEKLRLKVAAVLALIKVAEIKGVGRHPGLLMVDSPGAQEITPEDLSEFVIGLQEVAQEFQHLQVFIAGIASSAITESIPAERTRCAYGTDTLW